MPFYIERHVIGRHPRLIGGLEYADHGEAEAEAARRREADPSASFRAIRLRQGR
jgi:hypothetical protein